MPKPQFDLMKLPVLALSSIVRSSELVEVIEISMTSETFLEALKDFKIPAESLTFYIGDDRVGLSLELEKITIDVRCNRFPSGGSCLKKVNGEYVWWRKSEGKRRHIIWNFQTKDATRESCSEMIDNVVTHFLSILKIKNFHLNCSMSLPKFSDLSMILKYTKHFSTVDYTREDARKTPMTSEELIRLLEGITADSWDLNIRCDGFEYEKVLKCKEFHSRSIGWVTTNCLLSPEMVTVKIDGRPRQFIDFNKLIHYWVDGKMPNLQFVQYMQPDMEVDGTQVLRGIDTMETIFVGDDFRRRLLNQTNAVDIKRKSDGRRASVLTAKGSIEMCVWHPNTILGLTPASFQKYQQSIEKSL